MNKQIKYLSSVMIIILCILLLPYNIVFAGEEVLGGKTYTYVDDANAPNAVNIEDVKFRITCYGSAAGGHQFATEVSPDIVTMGKGDLNAADKYDKYTWAYIEIDGEKYVALAGSPRFEIPQSWWGGSERAGRRYDHIFYFDSKQTGRVEDCDKIQFKFLDNDAENFHDPDVYNGIIVDSGPMMLPQLKHPELYKEDENALDIYCGPDGESLGKNMSISTQLAVATMDGSFESNKKKSSDDDLDFVEWLMDVFARLIHIPIGDTIQKIIDEAGLNLNEQQAKNILYSRQDLESMNSSFFKYVEVDDADSDRKTQTIKTQNIQKEIQNKNNEIEEIFNESTKIPVIPLDAYSMISSKVDLFDVDFLSNNSNTNKLRKLYGNLVNTLSHVIMYICMAILIGMLIWRSILFISAIYIDNPELGEKSKKIMDNFVKAIALIVGIYLFSAIMVNLYNYLSSVISGGNNTPFNIRFVVKDVYSFNTNIISGIRYNTLSSNIGMEYKWSWIYLITAIVNGFWFMFMFIRMIVIGLLIIIAPITAVTTMGFTVDNDENKTAGIFFFEGWIKAFLAVLWIPFIVNAIMSIFLRL